MKKTITFLAILIATTLFAQNTYVPDDNFETYLEIHDANGNAVVIGDATSMGNGVMDNYVPTAKISGVTLLNVSSKSISDLTGIEDFAALILLKCPFNNLQTIDVSNNSNLTSLWCYSNSLVSLDLSANTSLFLLKCQNNHLVNLNVKNGNNASVTNLHFKATNNPDLTCILVDDAAYSTANWTIIDAAASFNETACTPMTYVPDNNFEQALIDLGYDSGALDNVVPTANISGVTSLDVHSKNISDLTGIQDFVALTILKCYSNQLASLDITNNTALTELTSYNNQLTSLDVSNNTALVHFSCSSNALTNLDVSNNTSITYLHCQHNQIDNLDLSQNVALTNLYCYDNALTSLNVKNGNNASVTNLHFKATNNPNLTCILVDNAAYSTANWTQIDAASSFNETACTPMTYVPGDNFEQALIDLGYDSGALDNVVPTANISGLTTLDVSNKNISDLTGIEDFVALTILKCYSNQLTSLDVTNNTALTKLLCSNNQLTGLNVTSNTALIRLICFSNQLTNLNVSQNTSLSYLSCSTNALTNLDVSNNTSITYLHCQSNQIDNLKLNQNVVLTNLKCSNNALTSLNVKNGNNANVTNLHFIATNNPNLTCIQVDDVVYSTANWTNIDATAGFSENCSGSTYVPDDNFETYLETHDANGNTVTMGDATSMGDGTINNFVPRASINTVTILNVDNQNISNLTGIQDFAVLEELYLRNDFLTGIDVSNNLALRILNIYNNNIGVLDVSNNTALEKLITIQNPIATLDLRQNTALTGVSCINSALTSFDIRNGNNTAITNLEFSLLGNNSLTCVFVDDAAWSTTNWTYVPASVTFVNNQAECDALSVSDNTFETQINLYPNPVKDSFTIINKSNYTLENLSIYDMLGKLVLQTNNTNNTIDVSTLKNGIYLVKITSNSNQTTIQKIVINN